MIGLTIWGIRMMWRLYGGIIDACIWMCTGGKVKTRIRHWI